MSCFSCIYVSSLAGGRVCSIEHTLPPDLRGNASN